MAIMLLQRHCAHQHLATMTLPSGSTTSRARPGRQGGTNHALGAIPPQHDHAAFLHMMDVVNDSCYANTALYCIPGTRVNMSQHQDLQCHGWWVCTLQSLLYCGNFQWFNLKQVSC